MLPLLKIEREPMGLILLSEVWDQLWILVQHRSEPSGSLKGGGGGSDVFK